uniref:Atp-dependent helicase-like n=2 Tax=Tetraselmis sp. GSL018 TaxID=582737 RepID=A0A061QS03_9CHLO
MELLYEIRRSRQTAEAEHAPAPAARNPLAHRSKRDRMAAAFGRMSRTAAASRAKPTAPRPRPACNPNDEPPDKVLVFSQWTSMLDLLEAPLRDAGINFRRLDGTMSVAQREAAVEDFKADPQVMVMIMSLKAAALGLNLVAANHVVLLDLWWNPTTEQQAIDRAHRIGQSREVHVTRITVEGTVEDRILALQEEKSRMVAAAFGDDARGGDSHAASRLTQQDLEYLFLGNR